MRPHRPKLSPEITTLDKVVNISGWITLGGFFISVVITYSNLPEVIPVHYSLSGEADRWSTKSEIWTLAVVVGLVFLALTFFAHRPRIVNFPIQITKENAQIKYNLVSRMMRVLRLTISLFFLGLFWIVINDYSQVSSSNFWFFAVGIFLILAQVIYYYLKLVRSSNI